eukprot:366020-Chlamydomonas_euryale.AAC.6
MSFTSKAYSLCTLHAGQQLWPEHERPWQLQQRRVGPGDGDPCEAARRAPALQLSGAAHEGPEGIVWCPHHFQRRPPERSAPPSAAAAPSLVLFPLFKVRVCLRLWDVCRALRSPMEGGGDGVKHSVSPPPRTSSCAQ